MCLRDNIIVKIENSIHTLITAIYGKMNVCMRAQMKYEFGRYK